MNMEKNKTVRRVRQYSVPDPVGTQPTMPCPASPMELMVGSGEEFTVGAG